MLILNFIIFTIPSIVVPIANGYEIKFGVRFSAKYKTDIRFGNDEIKNMAADSILKKKENSWPK